jgi:hypothetical protein
MRTPLPTLDSPQGKIPSRSDYSAPDGYFEKLPQRMTARIEGELANNHAVFSSYVGRWAVAASVLLIVGLAWLGTPRGGSSLVQGDPLLAQLTTDEIVQGLDLHGTHALWLQEAAAYPWTEEPAWIHPQDEPSLDSFLWDHSLVTVTDEGLIEL